MWPDRSVLLARLRRAPAENDDTLSDSRWRHPVIVVGIDSHKKTHTLVAVDRVGKRLTQLTVEATAKGHRQVCTWLGQFEQVLLAIEDCRHLTRRFEADLLLSGHAVVRVHTRLPVVR
ncbi:IS110 family transposase [Streptomyces adustus]